MQDARAIANFLLENFDAEQYDLTNMKINKMIYMAHGWHLVRSNKPLIRNHFEAWQFGPVVRVVFDAFKCFENKPVKKFACYYNYLTLSEEIAHVDKKYDDNLELVLKVFTFYINYTASELVKFTHVIDSPWSKSFDTSSSHSCLKGRIPNEEIYRYFFHLNQTRRYH